MSKYTIAIPHLLYEKAQRLQGPGISARERRERGTQEAEQLQGA